MIVFPLHLFACFYFNLKWHVRYILICWPVLWRLLYCNINEVISPPTGLQIWRLTAADCVKIFSLFPAIVISRSSCKPSVIISDGKPRAAVWDALLISIWGWFTVEISELQVTDHSSKCLPEERQRNVSVGETSSVEENSEVRQPWLDGRKEGRKRSAGRSRKINGCGLGGKNGNLNILNSKHARRGTVKCSSV